MLSVIAAMVGQIFTGAIGAYLALWAKGRWDRSGQKRDADIQAFREYEKVVTPEWLEALSGTVFYGGVGRSLLRPLEELQTSFGQRQHHYNDRKLNASFTELLSTSQSFMERIGELTTDDGGSLSTRYKGSGEEQRKMAATEGNELDQLALSLARRWPAFTDLAHRRLRI